VFKVSKFCFCLLALLPVVACGVPRQSEFETQTERERTLQIQAQHNANQRVINEARERRRAEEAASDRTKGYPRQAFNDVLHDAYRLASTHSKITILGSVTANIHGLFLHQDYLHAMTLGPSLLIFMQFANDEAKSQMRTCLDLTNQWRGSPYNCGFRLRGQMDICSRQKPYGLGTERVPCLIVREAFRFVADEGH
jgi:hypothetical protein